MTEAPRPLREPMFGGFVVAEEPHPGALYEHWAALVLVGQPDLGDTLRSVRANWPSRGVTDTPDEAVDLLCRAAPMLVVPASERRAVAPGWSRRVVDVVRGYDTREAVRRTASPTRL